MSTLFDSLIRTNHRWKHFSNMVLSSIIFYHCLHAMLLGICGLEVEMLYLVSLLQFVSESFSFKMMSDNRVANGVVPEWTPRFYIPHKLAGTIFKPFKSWDVTCVQANDEMMDGLLEGIVTLSFSSRLLLSQAIRLGLFRLCLKQVAIGCGDELITLYPNKGWQYRVNSQIHQGHWNDKYYVG
jgi:hypothetical protein